MQFAIKKKWKARQTFKIYKCRFYFIIYFNIFPYLLIINKKLLIIFPLMVIYLQYFFTKYSNLKFY